MFFQILNALCKKNNATVTAVTKELNMSTSKVTAWKNGTIPNGTILIKIAQYFNVSTDYLLGLTDNPNSATNNLTENEQDILKILRSIPDERKQTKFVGYIEAEAKKYINQNNNITDDIVETLRQTSDTQTITK